MEDNNIAPPPPPMMDGVTNNTPQVTVKKEKVKRRSRWGRVKEEKTSGSNTVPNDLVPPPPPEVQAKLEPVDPLLIEWKDEQEKLRDPKTFLLRKRKYKFDFSKYERLRRSHWDLSPEDVTRLGVKTYYPNEGEFLQTQIQEPQNMMNNRVRPVNQQSEQEREDFIRAQSRRIYVGNIPNTLTEEELMTFFNAQMITKGLIDYQIQKKLTEESKRKKMTPSVRKTKFSAIGGDEDEHDDAGDDGNSEFDLFKEGGPVTGCKINYAKNFAFLDFRSEQEASNSLNLGGIKLQNNHLKVRRPTDYRPTNPQEIREFERKKQIRQFSREGPFNVTELLEIQEKMTEEELEIASLLEPNLKIEEAVINLGRRFKLNLIPSSVIVLLNCINIEDFVKDIDYKDLHNDIKGEMKKYGKVVETVIPRPHREGFENGFNRIFVRFESVEDAKVATKELGGRKFQGRTVIVMYYNEEKFLKKEYE